MYIKAEGSVCSVLCLHCMLILLGNCTPPGCLQGRGSWGTLQWAYPWPGSVRRVMGAKRNDRRLEVTDNLKPRVCGIQGGCDEGRLVAYRLLSRWPWRVVGWQECPAWRAEDNQASFSPSVKAGEAPSYHHLNIGRNALRDIWHLSGAVPAWGLYERIGKQILSSPLIFTVSWHKAAGQYIPKLQMGMETWAKADEFQSRACDV